MIVVQTGPAAAATVEVGSAARAARAKEWSSLASLGETEPEGGESPIRVSGRRRVWARLGRKAENRQSVAPPIALCLIEHGADPNVKARDGKTPLRLAIEAGHTQMVDLLLHHGATE